MICNSKDSISLEQKSNAIYRIACPGCFQKYIGKTNLSTRSDKHGTNVLIQELPNDLRFNI